MIVDDGFPKAARPSPSTDTLARPCKVDERERHRRTAMEDGSSHLNRKSAILRRKSAFVQIKDLLIVDDESIDSDRLGATLRVILGYDVNVRSAPTIAQALDALVAKQADVVFLDDILKPSDNALDSIPLIRRSGFTGPIVVISGQVTRARRGQLQDAGAYEVLHKDELDSVNLAETLTRIFTVPRTAN